MSRLISITIMGLTLNLLICAKLIHHYFNPTTLIFNDYTPTYKYSIMDRNGVSLVNTTTLYSAYLDPAYIDNLSQTLDKLAPFVPNLDFARIIAQYDPRSRFIWLARHVPNPEQLESLNLPYLNLISDPKRLYPYKQITAHLLGFTDSDQNGLSGLEYHLNDQLKRNAVRTTIDIKLQTIIFNTLKAGLEQFQAKAGNALLINIHTGEILAYVSLPSYDPSNRIISNQEYDPLFDRNALGVYEFGSVLKITNLAFALESGFYTLDDKVSIPAHLQYGRFKISDFQHHQARTLTVLETLLLSSNKGNALMALQIGSEKQKEFFEKLGYFDPLADIPLVVAKTLKPKVWSKGTTITASYGHGIAMTGLHLLQGFARILTGKKIRLSLIKKDMCSNFESEKDYKKENNKTNFEQILNQKTAREMQFAVRECVQNGFAKKAGVNGLFVGGKTGTANLLNEKGKYVEKQNRVTILAAFPLLSSNHLHKDQFALLVCVERPQASAQTFGFATAGWIAAPIAREIIKKIAPILGIFE